MGLSYGNYPNVFSQNSLSMYRHYSKVIILFLSYVQKKTCIDPKTSK